MKRLVEVMAVVLVTATLWYVVTYASPCRPLPSQVCGAFEVNPEWNYFG